MNFEHANPIALLIGPRTIFALAGGVTCSRFEFRDKLRKWNFVNSFLMGIVAVLVFVSIAGSGYSGPLPAGYHYIPIIYDGHLGLLSGLLFGLAFALDGLFAKEIKRRIENSIMVGLHSLALLWILLKAWPPF